jgi:hypothetical protein
VLERFYSALDEDYCLLGFDIVVIDVLLVLPTCRRQQRRILMQSNRRRIYVPVILVKSEITLRTLSKTGLIRYLRTALLNSGGSVARKKV